MAIEPGYFHNHGATERDRFLAGTRSRGEQAIVIAGIGDAAEGETHRSVLFAGDASVHLTNYTSVSGKRLPKGTAPRVAEGLSPEDRDLALRLLNVHSETPVWWSLALTGATTVRGDGWGGETRHPAEGRLIPILVDGLGDPVVAAWATETEDQRWYIVPDGTDWDILMDWLAKQALPALVPTALRRVRSPHFEDPELQTKGERAARASLDALRRTYEQDRATLRKDLDAARVRAAPVRDDLLFGSGSALVDAVAAVLRDSGLDVVDLDAKLGATISADLLISRANGQRKLVEVKSASGSPKEDLVRDLGRHLATWPQLRPQEPVLGGVLIVNHQTRLHPTERTALIYSRAEFVDSLTHPVISTWQLFHWWADSDYSAIVSAMFARSSDKITPASSVTAPPRRKRWGRRTRS